MDSNIRKLYEGRGAIGEFPTPDPLKDSIDHNSIFISLYLLGGRC